MSDKSRIVIVDLVGNPEGGTPADIKSLVFFLLKNDITNLTLISSIEVCDMFSNMFPNIDLEPLFHYMERNNNNNIKYIYNELRSFFQCKRFFTQCNKNLFYIFISSRPLRLLAIQRFLKGIPKATIFIHGPELNSWWTRKIVSKTLNYVQTAFLINPFNLRPRSLKINSNINLQHFPLTIYRLESKLDEIKNYANKVKNKYHGYDKILTFPGSVRRAKGPLFMLRSLSEVNFNNKKVLLLIAGRLTENIRTEFDHLVERINVQRKITIEVMNRYLSDIELYGTILASHLVLLPYSKQWFSFGDFRASGFLLECMYLGIPVFAPNKGIFAEAIKNSNFLYDIDNKESFAGKLEKLVAKKLTDVDFYYENFEFSGKQFLSFLRSVTE